MLNGLLVALALQVQPAPAAPPPHTPPAPDAVVLYSYVPQRVYDSDEKEFTDFEAMLADLARAHVVLVGETHDDRNTHRLELAVLEGLMRRRGRLTVSLEMFERDVQQALSDYLAGTLDEAAFLQQSRPWPRYATDYRPMMEFARAHGWAVIAANVPRRIAGQVAKEGLVSIEKLPQTDRSFVAREISCPSDEYRKRFIQSLNEHPAPLSDTTTPDLRAAREERYYAAQCIKDETMAESIANAASSGHPLIVHYNGSFHSDYGLGTADRVKRRLKGARVAVVSIIPVDDLDTLKPSKEERKIADYLVYTLKPQPSPHERR